MHDIYIGKAYSVCTLCVYGAWVSCASNSEKNIMHVPHTACACSMQVQHASDPENKKILFFCTRAAHAACTRSVHMGAKMCKCVCA